MRRTGIFTQYTRAALRSKAEPKQLGDSALAFLASGETKLLIMFRNLAGCADPWDSETNGREANPSL